MEITCPRCAFKGEAAFEFKTNQIFTTLREKIGRSSAGSIGSSSSTARDREIGEFTVCPRCISVYAVATEAVPSNTDVRWGDTHTVSVPSLYREYQFTLLTAERLRRFSPEAQERLRSRMESYFKAHRDSQMRQDAIEYLQKYVIEYLRTEERQRTRLRDLTFSFVALSDGHPFHEALERLKKRGRIHLWEEAVSDGPVGETETMVRMV